MFENVREDMRRALSGNQHSTGPAAVLRELLNPGTQAVLVYRLGRWIHGIHIPVVRRLLKVFPGLLIHTWGGGVFFPSAPIGRHLTIIGGGVQVDYEMIGIGEEVSIAPGTKMIGKIQIGDRARTGPNSVVQADVPADCVVIGNPGRVIGPVPRITYEQGAKRIVPKAMAGGSQGKSPPSSSTGSQAPSQPHSQPQSPSPIEGSDAFFMRARADRVEERTNTRIPDHCITPDNVQSVVAIEEMLQGLRNR